MSRAGRVAITGEAEPLGGAEGRGSVERSRRRLFLRGLPVALSIPGFILFASAAGFGALARDAGISIGNAVLMMGAFFALPAQVVMTDQLARGGSLAAAAVAVTLIGVRLLPMTVVLMPYLRAPGVPRPLVALAVHAVAITAWIEGIRRLPSMPEEDRLPHFLGIGSGLVLVSLLGTAAGFQMAGTLPPVYAAALLFLSPVYFMLSLFAASSNSAEHVAIGVGAVLGPAFFVLAPGFDLLLTGLIGGSAAHFGMTRWRAIREKLRADGEDEP